jgi:ApaG protein
MQSTINIQVDTQYIYEQSFPKDKRYAFAYTIAISNLGAEAVQLLSRSWIITDANEKVQEVQGEGVVGVQPVIKPGESFTYTSGCLLETAHGTMKGSYQMLSDSGHSFDAEIPCFTLIYPGALH